MGLDQIGIRVLRAKSVIPDKKNLPFSRDGAESLRPPPPMKSLLSRLLLLLFLTFPAILGAHPMPDIAVRSHFDAGGSADLRVEIDPRSFEADPEAFDYFEKKTVEAYSPEVMADLTAKANAFVSKRLRFRFEPLGEVKPEFVWSFRKLGDTPLEVETDPAVLVGSWKTTLPQGLSGYRLESLKLTEAGAIPMNVVFLNHLDGKQVERYAVLFPGETSFVLDLTGRATGEASPTPGAVGTEAGSGDLAAVFFNEVKRGFLHVLPLGWDHVLFVLGLFLMSRKLKPIILQVSAFTLAHTITLWLASAGIVTLPPHIVEPIIAASIVAVALENLVRQEYSHWRLLVVFGFGLIHGLGFAGVMATRLDSTSSLVLGLLGINIGVELGQLAVILIAFLATCWITKRENYRKFVVIPGSILIALAGIWWVIERTLL